MIRDKFVIGIVGLITKPEHFIGWSVEWRMRSPLKWKPRWRHGIWRKHIWLLSFIFVYILHLDWFNTYKHIIIACVYLQRTSPTLSYIYTDVIFFNFSRLTCAPSVRSCGTFGTFICLSIHTIRNTGNFVRFHKCFITFQSWKKPLNNNLDKSIYNFCFRCFLIRFVIHVIHLYKNISDQTFYGNSHSVQLHDSLRHVRLYDLLYDYIGVHAFILKSL